MREVLRRGCQPVEERAPGGLRLLLIETLEHHRDVEDVPRAEGDLLAPMGVEQRLAVEGDDLANQSPKRVVRCRLDGREHRAEELRQVVRSQRELGHDTEAPATASLDRPEQVRMRAGIGDPDRPIGRDDFGFEEARRRHPVGLRKAAEAAALDETGNAHRQAAAPLDVAARLRRDGVVDLSPDRPGLHRDRRLRRRIAPRIPFRRRRRAR